MPMEAATASCLRIYMRILGIDTSTRFLCIGIYDNGKVYGYNLEAGRRLSSLITSTLKDVLDAAGLKAGDIDYFACGVGPGSFTGLRIGIATVKGMSWPLRKPVVAISSLDILSRNADTARGEVIPMLDARRGLVYCAIYNRKNNVFRKKGADMLFSPAELFAKTANAGIFLGDGVSLLGSQILSKVKNAVILDRDFWYPRPHNIVKLALEKITRGKSNLSDAFGVKPQYLYPKECQIRKK
ncbi:MAG: tRNA (adenosine(37)-N6)-threonylcarbamoyltransferase complex dimerization subunit type 1 TsaB [Candidatus Omnitrophota bacterium]